MFDYLSVITIWIGVFGLVFGHLPWKSNLNWRYCRSLYKFSANACAVGDEP